MENALELELVALLPPQDILQQHETFGPVDVGGGAGERHAEFEAGLEADVVLPFRELAVKLLPDQLSAG